VNANARDYLDGWIAHLLLNSLRPAGVALCTVWHSRDGTFRLRPLASPQDAAARIATLVTLYARGLARPLPYFPRSSWALVKSGGNLRDARSVWNGNPQYAGESAEPAFALAFRGVANPLDEAFLATAGAVLGGLLDHIDDPRL
ncbi:MAG TPA: exodeoxyribonuclease V subunit gamma, partial [Casimicrobiaceae bacterium]|nr:exodeoxyribonuclease V subunit gamma [Casimicrobiaceae bacterium]